MEMMTDPSHMGAERLAANMESYLASAEISHKGRGRSERGLPKSWSNVAAGEEELEPRMTGREEEKVFFSAEAKTVHHNVADW